jgi:hypothetical protein
MVPLTAIVLPIVLATVFVFIVSSIIHDSIWRGQAWGTTLEHVTDGLAYALVTAGTFGWLWPA